MLAILFTTVAYGTSVKINFLKTMQFAHDCFQRTAASNFFFFYSFETFFFEELLFFSELLSEMTQSPYHRVEFKVHNNEQTTSIKLALKPDFTLKDALNQVRNVWTAETNSNADLAAVNQLSVKDSKGFWLPQDSAVNCVLKLNDKVDVFVANYKRKPELSEVNF
jgi:hypothetical protein